MYNTFLRRTIMAHISSSHVQEIRNALKQAFPNFKFNVHRHSTDTLRVFIKSSPHAFSHILQSLPYAVVNPYWLKSQFPDTAERRDLEKMLVIIDQLNVEVSNYHPIGIGTGHRPFHLNLIIGTFDTCYKQVNPNRIK